MSQLRHIRSRRPQPHAGRSPWSIALLIVAAGLLVLAVYFLTWGRAQPAAAIEVTGSPRLRVDRDRVDLGVVQLGKTVQVDFNLTNVGDQTLTFTEAPYVEVVEGCCPPTPTIGSMSLQPGASTTLSVSFMMHGDMGGKHNFRVHIGNNDTAGSTQSVTILSNWLP
jgi:hypothetical protein